MKPSVVVIGSIGIDFVVSVDKLPAPGETVLGSNFQMIPGAKGANQACAAGKLGGESVAVKMIGRVGYDTFGDRTKASVSAAGVDVSAVHATRSQATQVALIWVDKAGQNSIVVAPGASNELLAADVEAMRKTVRGAAIALFQLESPLDTVEAALKLAKEEGALTVLDPAPAQPLRPSLLAHVDILTPNESEALVLSGRPPARISLDDAPALAQSLRSLGPRTIILKLGDQGCLLLNESGARHFPGFPVKVVDTTAAGDTFNAGLAVALAEGKPIEEAIPFANAAAAISVTRLGAQASAPGRAEVDALLAAHSHTS
jgi:ribokinase